MSDDDKMRLPTGKYCADCGHYDRCTMLFNCREKSTSCDWSPSRFMLKAPAPEPLEPIQKLAYRKGRHEIIFRASTTNQLFSVDIFECEDEDTAPEYYGNFKTPEEAEQKAREYLNGLPDKGNPL